MGHASRCLAIVATLVLASEAVSDAREPNPHVLLDRMNEAVRLLDYEGRFVVQAGDRLDAMHIVHQVDDGSEREWVVSLSGQPREIIRSDHAVACLVSGSDQPINVGRRAHGRSFSPLRSVSGEQLEMSYQIGLLEPGRVAGRQAHKVLIQPRDDLRYGYRLYIDKETSLPLRSIMFDEAQQPVSQMMFVELETGRSDTLIGSDFAKRRTLAAGVPSQVRPQRLAPPAWVFDKLPPGFQLNVHRRRALSGSENELEHFIFSDGLASVSAYIQPDNGQGRLTGESTLGPARAVGRLVEGHQVVVVGEVPVKTLHWFARQVRPATQ